MLERRRVLAGRVVITLLGMSLACGGEEPAVGDRPSGGTAPPKSSGPNAGSTPSAPGTGPAGTAPASSKATDFDCSAAPAAPAPFVTGLQGVTGVAADAQSLFYVARIQGRSSAALMTMPVAGGTGRELTPLEGVSLESRLRLAGDYVVASLNGGVHAYPRAGGEDIYIDDNTSDHFVSDGESVYVTSQVCLEQSQFVRARNLAANGDTETVAWPATRADCIRAVAVHGEYIYWAEEPRSQDWEETTQNPERGTINRRHLDGDEDERETLGRANHVTMMAVTGDLLYYNSEAQGYSGGDELHAVAVTGGNSKLLYTNLTLSDLVSDGVVAYATGCRGVLKLSADGKVVALAKEIAPAPRSLAIGADKVFVAAQEAIYAISK